MALQEVSPVTGIIDECQVVIDFGEHEGKSVLEVADTIPEFYDYLKDKRDDGTAMIKRSKDKTFRLYVSSTYQ